ncbi:class I poly(R)-hydroxyalkanoic acid synthase [Sphingobium indicum]|uniref:Poly(R)-hydroxyalkanoic acid synthase n=2 Tax=Sphingobium indicum TaxID=332055 RepID=I5BAA7_SPHIB|nr:class I poly(R)-hydroxyalkanoic acid synthase [Sphingobium indicum]APL95401.1 poly(R)-hydroxyalkanoic acid synthase [Sphingobium indicum B90A]KEY97579.1 poly(R)-hydroxyalkanoic acid synthase [Sphingomonas sp. BHC-A]NYI22508.1 polyhydroxyalkanoate synthase [Sphingobium indicum]RYM02502.1 class I poly(R)-hydroxyalkanoic acid synthase [Sphingobium indicum]
MKAQDVMEPHLPTLEDMQQWTQVLGRAQQLMLEQAAGATGRTLPFDPEAVARIQTGFADEGLALWQRFLDSGGLLRDHPEPPPSDSPAAARDRRFADPAWTEHPFYDLIRQSYLLLSDYLMKLADAVDGVDPKQKAKLRFATTGLLDAIAPSNFPLTNPLVVQKTIQSGGENLVKGLQHMLADLEKGQLTHTDGTAFELGRNIASTPGKVIKETPLYQLIHYAPTTDKVLETPLIIFPPWINRFYILDLSPEKSFVKWAVDQGISVFLVSWKSADASMKDVVWDDYILDGQIDAIDTVRDLLGVPGVHAIGYCVAGTTLAATLALLTARGEADKVASATFFTAQVDFSKAGDLTLFVDDEQMKMVEQLSSGGFLDGRYMAATFNLLRGRDLIWNYVVNNYLLGQDYPPFDLLYWNGDTTNLPARWHKDYLTQLYRDNLLVQPGAISVAGTPIDLRRVRTPAYVQAGREDHIAPLESVWKLTEHFSGPIRFLLAGSGHIAGVVNPPSAQKYQYWTCAESQPTLEAFLAHAKETKGSWWPDWIEWIRGQAPATVPVKGARRPGKGRLKALEDAPGRYVKTR